MCLNKNIYIFQLKLWSKKSECYDRQKKKVLTTAMMLIRDFRPGDLVWFDPGVGYVLPGEVVEFHKAAQVGQNDEQKTIACTYDEMVKTLKIRKYYKDLKTGSKLKNYAEREENSVKSWKIKKVSWGSIVKVVKICQKIHKTDK